MCHGRRGSGQLQLDLGAAIPAPPPSRGALGDRFDPTYVRGLSVPGADVERIRGALNTLGAQYPAVADRIDRIEVGSPHAGDAIAESYDGEAAVATLGSQSYLWFNPAYFSAPGRVNATFAQTQAEGWHVPDCDGVTATVYHEFAHHISYLLGKKTVTRIGEDVARALGGPRSMVMLSAELSGYSAIPVMEALAEGFTEYKLAPNPRPIASLIGRSIDEHYQRRFGR